MKKALALGLLSKPVLVAELGENALWGNYSKVSAYVSLSISTGESTLSRNYLRVASLPILTLPSPSANDVSTVARSTNPQTPEEMQATSAPLMLFL